MMTEFPSSVPPKHPRHNGWLILIAAFKLAQALLFFAVGVGALRLLHTDVGDLAAQLVRPLLRHNPESRVVNFILDTAAIVDDRLLRRIGAVVFLYAGLDLIEGIGLYLEKAWAEYLTLAITASFLPFEIFEVVRKLTWIRSGLLIINALVLIYLLKVVIVRGRERRTKGGAAA